MEIELTPEGLAKGNPFKIKLKDNEIRNTHSLIQEGRIEEALGPVVAGLIAEPKNPAVHQNLADLYEARGGREEAIGVAKGSVELHPDIPGPLLFLAEKYIRNNEHEEAIECCKKVIHLDQLSGSGWKSQGEIYWMLGRLGEAFECNEQLLQCDNVPEKEVLLACDRFYESAKPSNMRQFLSNAVARFPNSRILSLYYAESNLRDDRPGEAIRSIEKIENFEGDPLAVCVMARAYIDLGRPKEGLKHLNGYAGSGKDKLNVEALRAICLRLTGQVPQAKLTYEKLLKAGVESVPLYIGYATCLAALGLDNECLKALDKALDIAGNDNGILAEKAHCLVKLSRNEEARECLRSAAASWYNPISSLEGPSLVNGEFEDGIDWEYVESVFNQGILSRNERLRVAFALGHRYDSLGEHKEAMSLWSDANAAIRAFYNFDCEAFTSWIKTIPKVMTSLAAEPVLGFDDAPFRPVFVFGMPRSGTSLVEHILSSHSEIKAGGESKNINHLIETAMGCFPGKGYPGFLEDFGNEDYLALRSKFFSYWKFADLRENFVVDKMPGNFIYLGLLAKIFPEAVFIECTRDPYDTALSIFGHWFREGHPYAYDMQEILMTLNATEEIMQGWRAVLGEKRIHTIQYEKLVSGPNATIEKLFDGCGLLAEKNCFSPHQNLRPIDNANARRLELPMTDARIGRAKNYEFSFVK